MSEQTDGFAEDGTGTWSPTLEVRPIPSLSAGRVMLVDAPRGESVSVDSRGLAAWIGAPSRLSFGHTLASELCRRGLWSASRRESLSNEVRHWLRRGWRESLAYYASSRRAIFAEDVGGNRREAREAVLTRYLEQKAPPGRVRPSGLTVVLPSPGPIPKANVVELLLSRTTVRRFRPSGVDAQTLSGILWHGLDSVRNTRRTAEEMAPPLRYAHSHGVAFDFYLVLHGSRGAKEGVYVYDLEMHRLIRVRQGAYRDEVVRCLWGQGPPQSAALTLFIVADFAQYIWRYRHERALRNLYIESGRVAQRVLVSGLHYKFGGFVTPAIRDRDAESLLELSSGRQYPLYSVTLGEPAQPIRPRVT